jgi:hypothetical protein
MRATQGYLQPFRFTEMRDEECSALDVEIRELLRQARPFSRGRRSFGFRPARFLESS